MPEHETWKTWSTFLFCHQYLSCLKSSGCLLLNKTCKDRMPTQRCLFSGCHFNWYKHCASAASKDTWLCCKLLVSEAHPKKQLKTETNHLTMISQHIKLLMPRLLQEHVKIIDDLHHVHKICPQIWRMSWWFCCTAQLGTSRSETAPFSSAQVSMRKASIDEWVSWAVCGLSAVILVTSWWQ